MSSISVTPGYGINVSTKVVAGSHNQRVVAHNDDSRLYFAPSANPATSYADGLCIGGEVAVRDTVRAAAETAILLGLTVFRKGSTSGLDLDLIVRSEPLQTVPTDGLALAVGDEELRQTLGVFRIRAADFAPVGAHAVAVISIPSLLLVGSAGAPTVFATAIARGTFQLQAADSLSFAFSLQKN